MADNARPSKVVLVVEDDVAVRHVFERALIADGFSVAAVGNGHEALEFLLMRRDPGYASVVTLGLRSVRID